MNHLSPVVIITTTVATQEQARTMVQSLVEEHLVACAQIEGPIESVCHWQGKLDRSIEWRVVLKTTGMREPQLRERVMELHPYEVPQWLVVPTQSVSTPYEAWVQSTVNETPADSRLSMAFHVQICGADGAELGGSFDELQQFLSCQEQVYFEGDGSFGWTGPSRSSPGWALYGMLYDRDGRLQYAELQGCCPRQVWNDLIAKMTSSAKSPLIIQLPSGQLYALQDFEADAWPATV